MTIADSATEVALDVWADIACPWCFLGHRTLRGLLTDSAVGPVRRRHRAFLLRPDMPEEGMDYADLMTEIFGDRARARPAEERLAQLGTAAGIRFDFAAITVAANSARAHQAVLLFDGDPRQESVLDALYAAYWEQGRNISDPDVVSSVVAGATDTPAEDLRVALADGRAVEALIADLAEGREIGITAVPTVVADQRIAVQGAQPADILARLISEARR